MKSQVKLSQQDPGKQEVRRLTLDLWPDVGRALGLGRNSTFKAARNGQIPVMKIGRRLLVSKDVLARMLEAK